MDKDVYIDMRLIAILQNFKSETKNESCIKRLTQISFRLPFMICNTKLIYNDFSYFEKYETYMDLLTLSQAFNTKNCNLSYLNEIKYFSYHF